jgi:L-threonylcarbamoyladenylate synthase
MTHVLPINIETIVRAAALLSDGGLVAFPTETVYGLGADACNAAAVARIFQAKGRPSSDPLIVHLADLDALPYVAQEIPSQAYQLAEACWPGPLTLVLKRGPAIPPAVSAGRETVAVRIPAHPVAQALIGAAATPVAAPSANRFGHTSPTTAAHVLADLDGAIDLILDGGPTTLGVESTVLDLSGTIPRLLRPGGVSLERLQTLLGAVEVGSVPIAEGAGQIAPGLLASHYAPDSPLRLCIGPPDQARVWLRAQATAAIQDGQRVGLLVPDEDAAALADLGCDCERLGEQDDLARIARRLYAAMRALDARRPDLILARDLGQIGLARAVRDRLSRAAAGRVVYLDRVTQ